MKRSLRLGAGLLAVAVLAGNVTGCEDDEARANAGQAGQGGGGGGAGASGASGASGGGAGGSSGASGAAGGGAAGASGGAQAVQIPGLGGPVDALYDEHGFLHLECGSDTDCFAALGYSHAGNRFFFMDFIRHLVRGQLGSIVKAGSTVLAQDYANRQFFCSPQGEPLEDLFVNQIDAQTKEAMEAYSRGVNAWIDDMKAKRNGATLTKEYDFVLLDKTNIRAWEPQDSAAVGLYMLRDLSETGSGEIYLASVLSKLDPKLASDLLPLRPFYEAYTMTASGASFGTPPPPPPPSLPFGPGVKERMGSLGPMLDAALAQQPPRLERGERGSNNWVMAPSRTKAKQGLLANDPHLQLTNPSVWFPVEVNGRAKGGDGTFHAAGGSFPGLPLVMTGHNENIAWGVTVVYYDLTDVYVEELSDDGKKVKFNGQEVAIVEKEFTFEDSSTGTPVKKTFKWVPHHGPIIQEDPAKKQALSVRWVAHGGSTDLQGFLKLGRAGSTTEAREALKDITSANQNFIVVDKKGDIGWFPYGKVPRRPWASKELPPWLPLPGDGSAEWDGFVAVDKLPQMFNPPKGFVATANQEMTGASADGDPTNDGQEAIQSWEKAEGAREQRIVDLLEAGGNDHTLETMRAIQGDTRVLLAEAVVPALLEAGKTVEDAGAKDIVAALTEWKYTCPTGLDSIKKDGPKSADPEASRESIGCAAFHVTVYALNGLAVGDELKAADVSVGSVDRAFFLARALTKPETLASGEGFWDDVSTTDKTETRDEILRASMAAAAKTLSALGGKDDWRWGRVHTLTLRSIYDNFGIKDYNDGPYATPGGLNTVNVSTPSATSGVDLYHNAGPSLRTLIEVGPEGPRMKFQYPGGADLHRESPFYNNMVERWIKVEPVDFAFGPGAVASPKVSVTISPAP